LALRRRGRFGLLFVDGHTDFYQPEANTNGEAASSDLALATGRGPEILTMFEGYRPLVRDEDVVVLGFRDAQEAASYGSQLPPPEMKTIDLEEVRRSGIEKTAHEAVDRLSGNGLAGFWIHLDADALDDGVMPAVDYRLPDGLSLEDLEVILETALESPRAIGLEITIFNPQLDPDGRIARTLVDTLARHMTRHESKSGTR
jgi:arginase